jgi:nucleotide-binding universal stress UspA family protein
MTLVEAGRNVRLELIVGYDGSAPAQRALESAANMMRGRVGHIEVVYVAHVPSSVAMAPVALPAMQDTFEEEEQSLLVQAGETLHGYDLDWNFQRRNGDIATELLAAAEERLPAATGSVRVMLVVGGSARKVDRYLNSTPSRIIRHDRLPVLVIP